MLWWASIGTALAAVNPLGPRILLFPLRLIEHRNAFAGVAEWQPPHFHKGVEQFFAVQLALVVVVVLVRPRRWRAILPLVAFGLAALTSTRNALPASIVLTPIPATARSGLGSVSGDTRSRLLRPVAIAVSLLLAIVVVDGLAGPDTALDAYPQQATGWMRERGLLGRQDRVVAQDWVGNYLEYRYGSDWVRVFMDDRVDRYPRPVIEAFSSLYDEGSDYQRVLVDHRASAVLWRRPTPLGRWLRRTKHWRVVYARNGWIVALAAGARPVS